MGYYRCFNIESVHLVEQILRNIKKTKTTLIRFFTSSAFSLFAIMTIFCGCYIESPKHKGFMAHSDCLVYEDDVKSETIEHGRVEFIDTNTTNRCAKEQLKNTFLLYYDSICIAVYNNHPKENFSLIELFIKQYHSDTTDLSVFSKQNNTLVLTISLKCMNPRDTYANGKYFDRKNIELTLINNKYTITKEDIITNRYPWQDKK